MHLLVENSGELFLFGQDLLEKEIHAIQELKDHLNQRDLQSALQAMVCCTGTIMVTGSGTSGAIARRLAHLLTCSGKPAIFLDPGQCQHGYSAIIRPTDLIVAFSRGGETDELNYLLQVAQKKGAKVLGILENLSSSMAELCDAILPAPVAKENETIDLIPLSSTLVHAALGDILTAALFRISSITPQEFQQVHPGGAVGKRLGRSPGSGQQP